MAAQRDRLLIGFCLNIFKNGASLFARYHFEHNPLCKAFWCSASSICGQAVFEELRWSLSDAFTSAFLIASQLVLVSLRRSCAKGEIWIRRNACKCQHNVFSLDILFFFKVLLGTFLCPGLRTLAMFATWCSYRKTWMWFQTAFQPLALWYFNAFSEPFQSINLHWDL